ncbi:hypothetical protein AVEN_266621-1 [Araneus ventricosus]|uniref:Uncharacterized protein n=1 Tax=Araneus ventricosus TaxID=182803 RepID=A0A4Y2TYK0_ARAVE|nr:hypothetical protein AVEN_88727-1 [Araneus ventricosus]GBO05243.1 hypothetical protein AVEN_266621-1 [Araneus ventricosus]
MGVLPSLDLKQTSQVTSVGEVQFSTPPDKRNPPVLCTDPGLLISKKAFHSTTCKKSHHYVSLVSTLPTKVNVAPCPSNLRFVTLNCPVPFT